MTAIDRLRAEAGAGRVLGCVAMMGLYLLRANRFAIQSYATLWYSKHLTVESRP
jgi:hypothetical protein